MVALTVAEKGLSLSIEKTKEAFDIYAKLVAKKGVRVVFRGTDCYSTPEGLVVLPELSLFQHQHMTPEEVSEAKRFLQAVRGFALHEIGHHLFTNFDTLAAANVKGLDHLAWNLVEDVWMENKLVKAFAGGRDALLGAHEWLVPKVVGKAKGFANMKRGEKLGELLLAFGWTGRTGFQGSFFKALPDELQALTKKLTPYLERTVQCASTADCLKLGAEVLEECKRLIEEEEEEEKDAGDEDDSQSSGSGNDEDESASGGGDKEKEDEEDEDSTWSDEDVREATKKVEESKDENAFKDAAEAASAKALNDPRTYRVYSTEADTVVPAPKADKRDFEALKARVGQTANVIRNRLAARLRSKSNDFTVFGLEEGEFDASSAHRVTRGAHDVFREDVTEQSLRATGVLLLVNESGSMGNSVSGRMALAQQTALLFGEILSTLGIAFAIYGHTTDVGEVAAAHAQQLSPSDYRLYTILGATRLHTVKSFDESFSTVKERIPSLRSSGCTHDAHVLRIAGKLIAQEKRLTRRIIITIDDGEPHHVPPLGVAVGDHMGAVKINAEEVHKAVKELTAAGIETVGIGMQTNAVEKYYPRHVVINDLSDFNRQALKTLGDLLLK